MIGIYKITSPSNKIYIGQSINIEKRFNCYKRLSCKQQRKLYNSLKKYGHQLHAFEVIKECSINDLNILERHFVELYDTLNSSHGLNLREGGGAKSKMSESTKKLFSKNMMGNKRGLGKKCSDEKKKLLSIANKGNKGKIGKKHTEESKKRQSISAKKRGVLRSTIEASAISVGKPFTAVSQNGIKEYFISINSMAVKYSIGRKAISNALNGGMPKSSKYLKGWSLFLFENKN